MFEALAHLEGNNRKDSNDRHKDARRLNRPRGTMLQSSKTAALLAGSVGVGLGIGAGAFAFAIRSVSKLDPPPRALEEEAATLWGEPAAQAGEQTKPKTTYFDAFVCPLSPAARVKAKDLDGADLARVFFTSNAFRAESLLWDGTGLGAYLAKRGALDYSEETYSAELPTRFELGSRYEWWQMTRYDSRQAFLSFHSPGLLYVGLTGDRSAVIVGTAVSWKRDDAIWGSLLDDGGSLVLRCTHHAYSRLLASSLAAALARA